MRLHAAVWDGELRACPVWTAFGMFGVFISVTLSLTSTSITSRSYEKCTDPKSTVTHQSASSRWLTRKSKHCVWINEIKLYVFCDKYKEANMRRNKVGAFEIRFVSDEGTWSRVPPPRSPSPQAPRCKKHRAGQCDGVQR